MTVSMFSFACAIVFGIGFGYPLGSTIDRWFVRRERDREQRKWAIQCAAQQNAAMAAVGSGIQQAAQMSNSNHAGSGRFQ